MRTRFWIILDGSMLLIVVALQAWRLTGLPLHEWLGVALLGGVILHLLVHFAWIETRSRRLFKPHNARTRVNYALNLTLFISMTAAMLSGFMISKVVLPLHPPPEEFGRWHSIHDIASRIALFTLGLHLALNWDLIFAARPALRLVAARVLILVSAVILVSAAICGIDRLLPPPEVIMILPDGRRIEHAALPRDISALRKDELRPSGRGLPPFLALSGAVAVTTLIGRKVLRLRLE